MREGMRRDYKDFSLRMSSFLELGGCFEETSLRVFLFEWPYIFCGNEGYLYWCENGMQRVSFSKTGLAGDLTLRLN